MAEHSALYWWQVPDVRTQINVTGIKKLTLDARGFQLVSASTHIPQREARFIGKK